MTRKYIFIFVALIIFSSLNACAHHPMFYRAAEIKGQVVDAETKKPIEGVAVVAQWVLYHEGIADGGHGKVLKVYEAVTDKEGNYRIPAWGPRRRPAMTHLDDYDPRISLFKKDYEYLELYNTDPQKFYKRHKPEEVEKWSFEKLRKRTLATGSTAEHNRYLRESVWDGRRVELKKFEGDNKKLFNMLHSVFSDIIDEEDEGIPIRKVKYTAKEWAEAIKELKPPFDYSKLPKRVQRVLGEEYKWK